jgi:hypothetical protein
MAGVQFKLYADWNRDGDYSDSTEDLTAYCMMITWRLGMGRPWQEMADETTLQAQLANPAGRFNPENPASPLFGLMTPRVKVKLLGDGAVLWRGWVDFISADWKLGGASHGETPVMLYATGYKKLLEEARPALPIYQNKRGDEIIADLLLRVSLPPAVDTGWFLGLPGYSELGDTTILGSEADYSDLETGSYVFPYYGDYEASVWGHIGQITRAERGRFFFNRAGKAVWWNGDHLLTTAETTVTIDEGGTYKPQRVAYRYGKDIINSVRASIEPRALGSGEITLWRLPGEISLAEGGSQVMECKFVDGDGLAVGARANTVRVEGTSFSSGSGTVQVLKQLADGCRVVITNTGGGAAVLAAFTLVGEALSTRDKIVLSAADDESIALYGRSELELALGPLADVTRAQAAVDLELNRRSKPGGVVEQVEFINPNDGAANAHQLAWGIGTLARVEMADLYGHWGEYIITGEQHTIRAGQLTHNTIFYLEKLPRQYLTTDDGEILTNDAGEMLWV